MWVPGVQEFGGTIGQVSKLSPTKAQRGSPLGPCLLGVTWVSAVTEVLGAKRRTRQKHASGPGVTALTHG